MAEEAEKEAFLREFARRVERRRRIMDLTQEEVARHLDMSRGQYANIERAMHPRMQLWQVAVLAKMLRTSVDYFMQLIEQDPGEIPPEYRLGVAPAVSR